MYEYEEMDIVATTSDETDAEADAATGTETDAGPNLPQILRLQHREPPQQSLLFPAAAAAVPIHGAPNSPLSLSVPTPLTPDIYPRLPKISLAELG